jgi:hypothetical protein
MRLIRVFPRKTKATPRDDLARFDAPKSKREQKRTGSPDLLDDADEIHVSVTFTWDKPKAERLAEQWRHVAPVKIGGVAYGDTSLEFIPGRYIRPGYTITSRGCPRRCWFCSVWKKWPMANPLPIYDGWNVLDDNLLACPEWHVRAVFEMLQRQTQRVEFTGGLEAAALQDYQVDLLASLKPRPSMFWAYDPGDPYETLEYAATRMLDAGWTRESHRLRCYVLIGYPRDTFALAEKRLTDMVRIGFTPMAMLWKPEVEAAMKWEPPSAWRAFQRRWVRPAIIYGKEKIA